MVINIAVSSTSTRIHADLGDRSQLCVTRSEAAFEAATVIVKLAQRIAKRGLDVGQAAAVIGIDTQQLLNVLGGRRKGFSVKRLKKLLADFEAGRDSPPAKAVPL